MGAPTQTDGGHDMDPLRRCLAALTAHLDLRMRACRPFDGGGEVVRDSAPPAKSRVAKRGDHPVRCPRDGNDGTNPGGLPKEVLRVQAQLAPTEQVYYDCPAGPFYG